MPRSNRPRRGGAPRGRGGEAPLDLGRVLGGMERRESFGGEDWFVRRVSGAGSTKVYRCPGCQQELAPGIPHVVVWPADGLGGVDQRRHWHTPCWSARDRRRPQGSTR
ncbi:MAG TPA: hypothetical protein VFK66_07795 [Oryzihumus sp.]|nr:hypothetical protein [Oryzihumus sp.]